MKTPPGTLSWLAIFRLGLVQTALGAIVVLTTSTINRIQVVELALPALVPGALVALHHVIQLLRPRLGHGADTGGRRTPWIVGGMAVLALGGAGAAAATGVLGSHLPLGIALSVVAFVAIGLGVGAAGTSLLVLVAQQVAPQRRAAAATVMWTMMIAGFALTGGLAGHFLDPYSPTRLVEVAGCVCAIAFIVAVAAVWGVERPREVATAAAALPDPVSQRSSFRRALALVWAEPEARRFTVFVFLSMLAYSAQDLILEPFAGVVFDQSIGSTTKLSGLQNAATLIGMIFVAVGGSTAPYLRRLALRQWTLAGCIGSSVALLGIVAAGQAGQLSGLRSAVAGLGFFNGVFAVSAIGSMMELAGRGRARQEGLRMGLWGGAQAIAVALGAFLGTLLFSALRAFDVATPTAYSAVFVTEAALFVVALLFIGPARDRGPFPVADGARG